MTPNRPEAGKNMNDDLKERGAFKEFRAALARFNDANTPVSIADRVMILSNATFLLDEYVRAASPAAPAQSGEAIYQVQQINGTWKDVQPFEKPGKHGRIVYAAPQPAQTAQSGELVPNGRLGLRRKDDRDESEAK